MQPKFSNLNVETNKYSELQEKEDFDEYEEDFQYEN